jgi:hypothetical protein
MANLRTQKWAVHKELSRVEAQMTASTTVFYSIDGLALTQSLVGAEIDEGNDEIKLFAE